MVEGESADMWDSETTNPLTWSNRRKVLLTCYFDRPLVRKMWHVFSTSCVMVASRRFEGTSGSQVDSGKV